MTPMTSVCPGCDHEEACGHAEVHACAMRDPVEIARLSASAGTTAEEACANVSAAAVRLSAAAESPNPWCSCDPLRRAEAERDRYRDKALRLVCSRIEFFGGSACERCAVRLSGGDASYGYCDTVLREVDGV